MADPTPPTEPDPRDAPDEQPRETIEDEFTPLQRAGRDDPSAMAELWKAVYGLDRWYFMPSPVREGSDPDAPPGAHIGVIQGRPFLLAFTSAERVFHAARETKLHPEGAEVEPLWKEREPAAEWICSITDPIEGVLFNFSAGQGFFTTVDNVALMYDRIRDEMPPGCFDAFVRALSVAGEPLLRVRLYRRLALMDRWLFIGTPERPRVPSLISYRDANHAMIFTDEMHLGHAMQSGALRGPEPRPFPVAPSQAIPLLRKLKDAGKVAGVMVNYAAQPAVVSLESLEDALREEDA